MKIRLASLHLGLLLTALLPLAAFAAKPAAPPRGPAPVAGVDYVEIEGGQPYSPAAGQVEVVEVFGYTCIHCAHFEPLVSAWQARQRADVRFTLLAAPMGGYWLPYARAFFAAQSMGLVGETHAAMFRAVHEDGSLPINNATPEEIAGFYAARGADARKFVAAMASPAADAQLRRARDFMLRSGVEGTPSIVVNGRYRVLGKGFDDMLRITDYLVARERKALHR